MKIILASHGALADSMLEVLHMILGNEDDVESLSLNTYENPVALSEEVKRKIEAAAGVPVVLISDIRGGSVFNHLLPLCINPDITLFSGMNLDLVLSLVNIKPGTKEEFEEVKAEAKEGIQCFDRELLLKMQEESDLDSF